MALNRYLKEDNIKKALNSSAKKSIGKELLNETYVAQLKSFDLPTEKLSHDQKNGHLRLYQDYVESFNKISAELDSTAKQEANVNNSDYRRLKKDEIFNRNAIYLHELYFENISDLASSPKSGEIYDIKLSRDFGSFEDWEKCFIACALSAREGWVITYYDTYLRRYHNTFIDSHDVNIPVGCVPVIVLDMWTHSYFKDYTTDKKSYLINMMKELNWTVIAERMRETEKLNQAPGSFR